MEKRDYYTVLGVARDADARDIKKSYRKLAMEFHPDRNDTPEGEEKFKEASEAYEVLSDPQKRSLYDRAGFDGLRGSGFSGGANMEDIFGSFGDLFGDLFGMGRGGGGRTRRGPRMQRGADLQSVLRVNFNDAVFGCEKEITIERHLPCGRCDGSGAEPGSRPEHCGTCAGRGQVMHGQGMFVVATTCPDCRGQGEKISQLCRDCNGQAMSLERVSRTVKVPAGMDNGVSIRYPGEGEPGLHGGPSGHLYISVDVRPHKSLRREGFDVISELTIGIAEAALGTEVTIEGIDGEETIKIPKGTQPSDVITLKGKGVPRLQREGRGALHVVVIVEVPRSLSTKQKKVLQEFQELSKKRRGLFS